MNKGKYSTPNKTIPEDKGDVRRVPKGPGYLIGMKRTPKSPGYITGNKKVKC